MRETATAEIEKPAERRGLALLKTIIATKAANGRKVARAAASRVGSENHEMDIVESTNFSVLASKFVIWVLTLILIER